MVKKAATAAPDLLNDSVVNECLTTAEAPAAFAPAPDDLIDDILEAVLQMAPSFCAALAQQRHQLAAMALAISDQKHREYAGDRVYIPGTTENARRERSARNRAIQRDHQSGERMMLLERRYKLSKQAIWKIINSKG